MTLANHVCFVVPPYLLTHIVAGRDKEASRLAKDTLRYIEHVQSAKETFFKQELAHSYHDSSITQNIVPDHLLHDIVNAEDADKEKQSLAAQTIVVDSQIRDARVATATNTVTPTGPTAAPSKIIRSVYDLESHTKSFFGIFDKTSDLLPGKLARTEGQDAMTDKAVNQVYENTAKVYDFFQQIFRYNSLDGKNMPIVSTVHFGQSVQNASWIASKNQMIYGDGGGDLVNFTNCIDIIGHEMTHAITQFNSHLVYQDESGALNEHISDVFGIMVKQWIEKKPAKDADWLVGESCFMPEKKGVALRNMKNPGTAYSKTNTTIGGDDPQPADYKGVEAFRTNKWNLPSMILDHGGVHIFSGVPNRAFVLSALEFGGYSWEKAGRIWWITATTNRIAANCSFIQFADVTVAVAQEQFDADAARIVRKAWDQVGVIRGI